ncbi:MAG: hypothetical protein GF310_14025 [candidate division Zixibacteria bacterium]|nr:hypothetical protein [candidate division Zixibacteria bacterium]
MHPHFELNYIIDANVLIDFCDSDLNILRLFSTEIGSVHIGRSTFDKVDQLSESKANKHDLTIIAPSLSIALEAGKKRGALAYDDHETLLLAKEQGLTVITNDKALRRECKKEGVQILWGLEPLKLLTEKAVISVKEACRIATIIHKNNSFYISCEILARFVKQVKNL